MKPITTDTYDFPTLIECGYVYVDKTAYLRRNYAAPYAADKREIFYMGVNYDTRLNALVIETENARREPVNEPVNFRGEVVKTGGYYVKER